MTRVISLSLVFLLSLNGGTLPAFGAASATTQDALGNPTQVITLEEIQEHGGEIARQFLTLPPRSESSYDFLADDNPLSTPKENTSTVEPVLESDDPFADTSGTWGQSYDDLWWHDRVLAEEAWAYTRGEGVTIAVIDSGLDVDHPDIAENLFQNLAELNGEDDVDDDGNGFIDDITGWDFVFSDNDPNDFHGHGTHVAGILGAVADNAIGIAGIAPEAAVLPLRVLDSYGDGFLSDVTAAIRYAADIGAEVINMSIGVLTHLVDPDERQALEDAVQYAHEKGSILVAAAGNEQRQVSDSLPSGIEEVIAAGATHPGSDNLASFSNFGEALDLVAPGVDILSLKSGEVRCTLCDRYPHLVVQDDYMRLSGTSMASPIVAGAVALMLAYDPLLTLEDIRRRFLYSSDDLGVPGRDDTFGSGMLNIVEALSTDYYETGEIKTRWFSEADEEGVVRIDFDLLGRISRETFSDGTYAEITYWPVTTNRFERFFYDEAGVWQRTEEYYEDGLTLHVERFSDGTVLIYDPKEKLVLNFNDFTLSNLRTQSLDAGQYEILEGGQALRLYGNNWKGIQVDQTITSATVLEFDFKSTGADAEINSIGFSPDLKVASVEDQNFQFFGSQVFGNQDYSYIAAGDWQHFVIPVGDFFTGFFEYLIFADDADQGQATDVQFRNISIWDNGLAPPSVDPFMEVTNQANVTLTGAKAAETSLWLNGVEIIALDSETAWSVEVTLPSEGPHPFSFVLKDNEGNESEATEVEITLDTIAPTGSVVIDDGALVTHDLNVDLTLDQTDANPDQMRLFVDGVDATGWIDYQVQYLLTLPTGDGLKEVRVEFQDKAGNISTDVIADTITLEEVVSNFLNFNDFTLSNLRTQSLDAGQYEILEGGQALRLYGNNWKGIRVDQTITADTVLEFDFKSTSAEAEINSIGFSPDLKVASVEDQNFQFFGSQVFGNQDYSYIAAGDWQHFVIPVGDFFTGFFEYLIFADDADQGQATDVQFRNISIWDNGLAPPSVDPFMEVTNQANVTLTGAKEAETSLWLNGVEIIALDSETAWSVEVTLPSEGPHPFSFVLKDNEGNESEATEVEITLDTIAPTGSVVIDDGALVTHDLNVDLTLDQTDANPDQMRLFIDGVDATGWIDYQAQYLLTLPTGDGLREVRVEFQDKAGNISTDVIADTITLEEVVSNFLNFNDFTLSNLRTQSLDAGQYEILEGGQALRLYGNNWKGIQVDQTITSATVLEFDFKSTGADAEINSIGFSPDLKVASVEDQNFQFFGSQVFGNQDYSYIAAGDWQHFVIPVGDFFTGFFEYLIFADDADQGQATDVQFRNISIWDNGLAPPSVDPFMEVTNQANVTLTGAKAAETSLWLNGVEIIALDSETAWSVEVTLPSEGPHPFSFVLKDNEGNESEATEVEITLDTIAPTGSVVIDDGALVTHDLNVDLTLDQTDANPDQMRLFIDGVDATGWIDYQAQYLLTLPTGDGLREVRVEFQDKAGNISTDVIADTITLEEVVSNFLNFNDFTLSNLRTQSLDAGQYEILEGGQALRLYGNNWKGIQVDQTITSATVLEFDFKSTGADAEINSIGFSPDLKVASVEDQNFQIFGSQIFGFQDYAYTGAGGWQHFVIPVGDFFTGFFEYLIFADDADKGQATDVQFRNISIQ